ncbi:MAG: hypothetical protein RR365_00545 [Bacteroides sp.]
MAHVETWYRCPCGAAYTEQKEALKCATSHVRAEKWAVGDGAHKKAVRIYSNHVPNSMNGILGALREAELSDDIQIRRQQLREEAEYGKDGNDASH